MDAKGAEALREYIEAKGLVGVEVAISPLPFTKVTALDRWFRAADAREATDYGQTAA